MNKLIQRRAARKLAHLHQYLPVVDDPEATAMYREGAPLGESEVLLGVYENTPGAQNERILVTDRGIYVFRHTMWEILPYAEMEEAQGLRGGVTPERKRQMDGFIIRLRSGNNVWLPVRGAGEGNRDAFGFLGFVIYAISDVRAQV